MRSPVNLKVEGGERAPGSVIGARSRGNNSKDNLELDTAPVHGP